MRTSNKTTALCHGEHHKSDEEQGRQLIVEALLQTEIRKTPHCERNRADYSSP
jgi:hypothetical protein